MLQHCLDFATSASAVGDAVKDFPELIDGVLAGPCASVDQAADVGIKDFAKSIKEPSMRVDLLLVLLLEAEEDLDGRLASFDRHNVVLDLEGHLRRIFVDVGRHVLVVDLLLCNAFLVNSHGSQNGLSTLVDLCAAVTDDADDNLLPGILSPSLAIGPRIHVLNVLDDANHCPCEELILLVVHCDYDEQLRVSWLCEKSLAKSEAFFVEAGRVTRSGCISHVCEFVALASGSVGDLVEQSGRHRTVQDEVTLEQLNLLDCLPPSYRRWRWSGLSSARGIHVLSTRRNYIVCIVNVLVRIRTVGCVCLQHGSGIDVVVVIVAFALIERILANVFAWRRLVEVVVVGIVVSFGIDGVGSWREVLLWRVAGGRMVIDIVIITIGVGDVFHRVLSSGCKLFRSCNERRGVGTVGCASRRSLGVPGPMGISSGRAYGL